MQERLISAGACQRSSASFRGSHRLSTTGLDSRCYCQRIAERVSYRGCPCEQLCLGGFSSYALMEAEIAAAAGTPALAVAARRYHGAHTIMPPARLWPFNPSYGIVAMRDDLIRHRDVLRRFLVAHETACEMIRHHLDKCAQHRCSNDRGCGCSLYSGSVSNLSEVLRFFASGIRFIDDEVREHA